MDDVIRRRAMIDWCNEQYENMPDSDRWLIEKFTDAIEQIPSVEPKRGHWEHVYKAGYRCSECKAYLKVDFLANYCPNCGAEMRGDAE